MHDINGIPEQCTFKQARNSEPCSGGLWKHVDRGPLGIIKSPCRKYVHQGLKAWLGRLLSRPGMEKTLHDYPRDLLRDFSIGDDVVDIWQGEVFRGIKDSSHRTFFPGPPGELRLAFGLSLDGFSAFQNKTAKQSATSTGIWLILYNLPWHLRYLPQNIYLAGVIPGPNKPSNDQINHYIRLVVADLQELWRPGIFFTRTHDVRQGRLCKGLLIPLICDLLGAHQVIGYPGAPTAHYFCTCCELDIDDINVVDFNEWPRKDLRHIRRYAQIYRDSPSETAQQAVFEACGWRWSPLFELEYWDPPTFTAIDAMHAIDLHLLKNQVQGLFQIDLRHKGGDALRPPSLQRVKRVTSAKPEIKALKACQEHIFENPPLLLYELLQFPRKVLYSFCLDYDIRRAGQNLVTGTRWVLAKLIYQWVSILLTRLVVYGIPCNLHYSSLQRQNTSSPTLQAFQRRYPLLSPAQDQLIVDQEREDDSEDDQRDAAVEGAQANTTENQEPIPALPKAKALCRLANRLLEVAETDMDPGPLYKQTTVPTLAHFCDVLSIERTLTDQGATAKSITAKQRLFTDLIDKVSKVPPSSREYFTS